MTKQERFKRRIRARMAATGERYGAARRALIDRPARTDGAASQWVHEPETSDDAVRAATGIGWDHWVARIESAELDHDDHAAIAQHLERDHGLDGWWAQTVTVGFERITGRRAPGQRRDGTYSVSVSRTVELDGETLRRALLDDAQRRKVLDGRSSELRSRSPAKVVRLGLDVGTLLVTIEPRNDERCRVVLTHERLPDLDAATVARRQLIQWLDELGDALTS